MDYFLWLSGWNDPAPHGGWKWLTGFQKTDGLVVQEWKTTPLPVVGENPEINFHEVGMTKMTFLPIFLFFFPQAT